MDKHLNFNKVKVKKTWTKPYELEKENKQLKKEIRILKKEIKTLRQDLQILALVELQRLKNE